MSKKIIYIVIAVAVVVAGYFFYVFKSKKNAAINWQTAKVFRGDLKISVTATGTVNAITTVLVGTQVSGTISKLFVDYNTQVTQGQIIAVLDTIYLAQAVANNEAAAEGARVAMEQAKRVFDRDDKLYKEGSIAQIAWETDLATYETTKASYTSAKAQARQSRINLNYATIKAPINGVIISRNIDVGQTVAASFSTPTLFTIANDLTKMQVEASVDEADIGGVKQGQISRFTVDAFPTDTFQGVVHQIRLSPTTTNSVVKYTVIINVDNKDLKLLPGMTANLSILVDERKDVLLIPSIALSFTPPAENMDAVMAALPDSIKNSKRFEKMMEYQGSNSGGRFKKVWTKEKDYIMFKKVKTGATDGVYTEITESKLKEGDEVITGIIHEKTSPNATQKSPFMPTMPKGGGGGRRF